MCLSGSRIGTFAIACVETEEVLPNADVSTRYLYTRPGKTASSRMLTALLSESSIEARTVSAPPTWERIRRPTEPHALPRTRQETVMPPSTWLVTVRLSSATARTRTRSFHVDRVSVVLPALCTPRNSIVWDPPDSPTGERW